jgi:glycerophosphoryl diester phosphodiesterase
MQSAEGLEARIERTGGYPVYVAHRGGAAGPENTLHTCRLSAAQWPSIRMLEVDVRLTRDKELVLMHDSSVDRTTDGQGAVNQYTLAELRQLDAAHLYPALRRRGITVPTLVEFLDEFVGDRWSPDLMFMFDFKDCESVERAWPLIQSYGGGVLHGRYMLGSVFEEPNRLLGRLRDPATTPLMTDIAQTFALTLAYNTGLWAHYEFGRHDIFGYVLQSKSDLFFTAGLVQALHAAGMRVLACGPNLAQPAVLEHCQRCRIDYIMVDALPR